MLKWLLHKFRSIRPMPEIPPESRVGDPGERRAHPLNVPGPLYVEEGCCLSCGVWELEGAGLLAWDNGDYPQCYVSRQPESDDDYRNVAAILAIQDVDCIRVRNCPSRLRAVLKAAGQQYYIDS